MNVTVMAVTKNKFKTEILEVNILCYDVRLARNNKC